MKRSSLLRLKISVQTKDGIQNFFRLIERLIKKIKIILKYCRFRSSSMCLHFHSLWLNKYCSEHCSPNVLKYRVMSLSLY